MTYIQFDKEKLINLEQSLSIEMLRANSTGSFASTSVVCCNTRKYHGLLITPVDEFNGEKHVLLSSLDETVIQHGSAFNLGIHRYKDEHYEPKGHKYLRDLAVDKIPVLTYRVGGVVLSKEIMLSEKEDQLLIRYTLKEAHSPTKLRLKPFLAFRNIHQLTASNMHANTKIQNAKNGIKAKLYPGFPYLHMQVSVQNEFVPGPDWYNQFEYVRELERGYDCHEDLFMPGFFEFPIKKGQSIVFSASTKEVSPTGLKTKFNNELNKRNNLASFRECLQNAARQFVAKRRKKAQIIAGYPWFGSWARDTFISLPGLTLALDKPETCEEVLDTMVRKLRNGLFPNNDEAGQDQLHSLDAPFWFIWAIQKLYQYREDAAHIWNKYGKNIKSIFTQFQKGLPYHIQIKENGLIYGGQQGYALTWMDAIVEGKSVTPRIGYDVEINALWYNSMCFALELADINKDEAFTKKWKNYPEKIAQSFNEIFWLEEEGYLADYVNEEETNRDVRPNMLFATSLAYSPINKEQKKSILDIIESELLTPRGLRTLSPKNPKFKGIYEGDQTQRDNAYHQGTVWPWLTAHFIEGYLGLYKKSGISFAKQHLEGFEETIDAHCIGSISEIFDGNPPHEPRGAISQAWSVAELLRSFLIVESYNS